MIENNRPTELIEVYVEDAEWIREIASALMRSEAYVVEDALQRPDRPGWPSPFERFLKEKERR